MARLTINDIANLAHVSIATVSNYLNGNYQKMSLKTRTHLEEIINQTNYRPNGVARNLAKNENKTIGVSIADITNPFTSSIMSGIYDVCDRHGYKVLFTNANNNPQNEINNILRLRSENVAGFIIDPVDANSAVLKLFSNDSTVIVDRQSAKTTIDTIVTDNSQAVYKMTRQMLKKGYKDLYFVSWPLETVSTRILRYQGFLKATHYKEGTHLLTVPHNGEKPLYQKFNDEISHIMNDSKSKIGFFTMNARVFIRLLKAMQQSGYDYPKDYGLATYEEFEWMKLLRPSISCIHQDSVKIGTTAADLLITKLGNHSNQKAKVTVVPTKSVIKHSF